MRGRFTIAERENYGGAVSPSDGVDGEGDAGLPWWPSGVRRRGGNRSSLTLERIIDAGVDLVDKQGFEALTMRRVAECLNCGVMSLYWYVANREELASVVVDALLRSVPTPPSDMPWRQQVLVVSRAFVSILHRHRRVLAGFAGGVAPGPQLLRMTNDIYGALRNAGFSGEDLFQGVDAIGSLTIGFLFGGASDDVTDDEKHAEAEQPDSPRGLQDVDFTSMDPNQYPNLAAAGVRRPETGRRIEFALNTLLDGLELRLVRDGGTPGTGHRSTV
jgi:AcrR family transcriptional regulator